MTRPASGRPASSSRARSSAPPIRVVRALVRELGRRLDAIGRRGKAEETEHELLRQRVQQRAVGAERVGDERAARPAVAVGDLQAAGIVEQHAEEILLRHRGLENQRRPQQAERDDRERARAAAPPARRGRGRALSTRRDRSAARSRRPPRPTATASSIGRETPSTKSPCSKNSGGYLNRNRKSDSNIRQILLPPCPPRRSHENFFLGGLPPRVFEWPSGSPRRQRRPDYRDHHSRLATGR